MPQPPSPSNAESKTIKARLDELEQALSEEKERNRQLELLVASLSGRETPSPDPREQNQARIYPAGNDLYIARMKDEFLASMSHELRTPLTGVLGLTEALLRGVYGSLNEKQAKALTTIEESGKHLLSLINDILDLSKIEAGKLEISMGAVALEPLCQGCLRSINHQARARGQKVEFLVEQPGIQVQGDARRLKQILINLLDNAIKFTPAGGDLGLAISANAEKQQARITVWDKGIGIAAENLPHLFQPFQQLDSRLAREYNGTGLGLALSKHLAELQNGWIEVESQLAQGSSFTLVLPWDGKTVSRPAASANIPSQPILKEGFTPSPLTALQPRPNAKLVLVAEDNRVNAELLHDVLTAQGFAVITVHNGQDAVQMTAERHPDLVIMDVQMPAMDGLSATRQIRNTLGAYFASLPVIALTALSMPGERERCLEAGANEYLSKPINIDSLLKTIKLLLQPKTARSK